jgi:hypothetical protein
LRLIATAPSNPTRVLPKGSWAAPSKVKGMVTGLVTPLIVRSPVSSKVVSSTGRTAVETKVISGCSAIARKSLLRRCSSRWALRVSMLAALMVTRAEERVGLAASMVAVPSNSLNAPRTLVTIACRATKPIRVWAGSRV